MPVAQTADVVLAMRSHMKAGSWAREAAKEAGTPVYAVKHGADSTLVRALETLLGSANGVLGGSPQPSSVVQYQNHVVSMVRRSVLSVILACGWAQTLWALLALSNGVEGSPHLSI